MAGLRTMLRALVVPAVLLASVAAGLAQSSFEMKPPGTTPFGMSPATPAAPAAPAAPPVGAAEAPFQMVPGRPAPTLTVPGAAARPAAATAPAASATQPDRMIVPMPRLVLEGETDAHAWTVNLTAEEAARPATFWISYLNAVVVMPEASRLRVTVNGQNVFETPINASQAPARLSAQVRAGLLRAGPNLVRFDVVQRHRTDCSVSSTYELWTQINGAATGLSFAGGAPPMSGGAEALPAFGLDAQGSTTLRIALTGPLAVGNGRALRAAQALALHGRFANPVVTIAEGDVARAPPGTLTVVLGMAGELPRVMGSPPPDAADRPVARFVNDQRLGPNTFVISGPTLGEVDAAIERLATVRPPSPDSVATASWNAPDAPLFNGARGVRLADLGVSTQEFSGRRLRVRFAVALPADFYATAYGEGRLLLDAAYTDVVRPGSHVDLYVNGQIASTIAVTSTSGGLLQREPINFPLLNFRPGVNEMWLEVILDTEADERCLPGTTLPGTSRFVLFDSSEFQFDDFARIGRRPDLAAFAASAFPYNRDSGPLALVLGQNDAATLSAAGTLLTRLALASGAVLPLDLSPVSSSLSERSAIFVGAIGQIAPGILTQVGIADTARVNWLAGPGEDAARPSGDSGRYDDVLNRFRERQKTDPAPDAADTAAPRETGEVFLRWRDALAGGGGVSGLVTGFEAWMKRTFNISYASLRFGEAAQSLYEPASRTSVLMAQGTSPSNAAAWTVVAGRSPELLAAGLTSLTVNEMWIRISGHILSYQASTGRMDRREGGAYDFVVTEPLGFVNLRLVAANWLSINILPYALMLVAASVILGIATSLLLRRLGRTS
ncbi:MAG TPA: cellulose biosynthesis cyclic di-GMP-binding regulatory protein BcsB [Xanthobacteraceae bacterium]|nr:cellulose biosynthesis cyclic di-GMP-binding regulatory protein BcsB [Xanthobacteraceae bacterium]